MMDFLYWGTAIASLIAVWLNIRKIRWCFLIWAFSNAIWTVADFRHDLLPQAALQFVYFNLSLYGIWKWSTKGEPQESKE